MKKIKIIHVAKRLKLKKIIGTKKLNDINKKNIQVLFFFSGKK